MIYYMRGNLFDSDAEVLVNTVNCVGVMGKGIAYHFRRAFPRMYEDYRARCRRNEIRPGEVTSFCEDGRVVVNFPTKRHWRNRSLFEDIESGLEALRDFIKREHVRHIAIPPLGCGNGGLDWPEVRRAIDEALSGLSDIRIDVYEPHGDFGSKVA